MQRKGVNQTVLQIDTGISSGMISEFLRGKKSLSADRLAIICKALDIELIEFINNGGSIPADPYRGALNIARDHDADEGKLQKIQALLNQRFPLDVTSAIKHLNQKQLIALAEACLKATRSSPAKEQQTKKKIA